MRWFAIILGGAFFLCIAGTCVASYLGPPQPRQQFPQTRQQFPPELLPSGAFAVVVTDGKNDLCYVHRQATVRDAGTRELGAWAAALDLPCVTDAGECSSWSTAARESPFWQQRRGEVNGLDTVTATLSGGVLTIDWGDYMCAGPN